jgi:hypothetical protein
MRRVMSSWVLWLGLATVTGSGLTVLAQAQRQPGPDSARLRLITGNDIGFRVDGTDPRTGNPTGTWMVRVGGEWLEVGHAPLVRPAK